MTESRMLEQISIRLSVEIGSQCRGTPLENWKERVADNMKDETGGMEDKVDKMGGMEDEVDNTGRMENEGEERVKIPGKVLKTPEEGNPGVDAPGDVRRPRRKKTWIPATFQEVRGLHSYGAAYTSGMGCQLWEI
ncbi:hypothetical protein NDU88_003988 [Pleurodeles waltl]|uniref:Uncharacterized protein n=1 Tax=Pleurodeles waltl TaxID=8319 RepID=A0AAV7QEP7_PLEWA|nr:hypothetical protein NDU88_003988 [Pleurodeles waltl]